MDCGRIGQLLKQLRMEKGLTQRSLAQALNISDKTVSKWERGMGCPDVSLLNELSRALNVQLETLLAGELTPNDRDGGNMKRIKFYGCPTCGNLLTATGEAEVSCCGRVLAPEQPRKPDEAHSPDVQEVDGEWYVTLPHEMSKGHFIRFFALVGYDRMTLVRLYPEQEAAARLPKTRGVTLYYACSEHGLYMVKP